MVILPRGIKQYLLFNLLALDCMGTALVGGYYGETLSSYAYRMHKQGKPWGKIWKPFIDWLFSWQHLPGGHCYSAYLEMRARLNMPPELR